MTEPAHLRESQALRSADESTLDSTAQLLTRITAQLGTQLSHLHLNGTRRPMSTPDRPTLVAVAHGSRDARALPAVTALLDRVRALRPGLRVRLGHIELNAPLLTDTLAALGDSEAVLVPLLFGRGYHVKHDLPGAACAAPGPRTLVAPPLGPHPLVVEALHARLVEAGWRPEHSTGRGTGVVLAAAGSRDPESAADTRRLARLLSERLGGVPVVPAYASAASPTVPEAIRALAARGRHQVAVASCFTAPGLFATRCAAAAPWIASAPLGPHPALARLVLRRYEQALATRPAPHPLELASV
ncbi:sirohydrochlorin chelatase [Streptomyces sp. SP18CS02]|uniref:sirohydrochlorin chelatase n=1 Tax=Streptomyces sp. SP18CS02 TaxID=3002531 RepID=UPI002E765550|nr:sirohydrochlorin chelatase [Streptomyces sp. SP18CS02]MEE1753379.1 sirohydrochlorin chelatase [Streptomyces sp. SP18CS02]